MAVRELLPFIDLDLIFRHSKVIRQTNINMYRIIIFNTWMQVLYNEWPPEVCTTLNVEIPSLSCFARPLLQVPSLAACLCLSFHISFVFSKWKAPSAGLRSGDWLLLKNIPFHCLEKLLGCFRSIFWVIVHLYCEALSYAAFDWNWVCSVALYTSEFILPLLSAVTSSINAMPCYNTASTMLDMVVPGIMSPSFLFPDFSLPIIVVQIHLSLVQRI